MRASGSVRRLQSVATMVSGAGAWWGFVLRGVLAILFGALALLLPGMALFTLVLLFSAYVLAEGVANIVSAVVSHAPGGPRPALLIEGIISLAAGVVAFWIPGITTLALLFVIAGWSIASGVLELVAAVRMRKELEGEWLLALSGLLSIGFGLGVALFPGAGALALVVWIAAYALSFGIILVALGFRLRAIHRYPYPPVSDELVHGH